MSTTKKKIVKKADPLKVAKARIAELERHYKAADEQNDSYAVELRGIRKALFGETSYRNADDLVVEISKLKDRELSHQNSINSRIHYLDEENARLWHLVRSLTADKTLMLPQELPQHRGGYDPGHSPFRNGSF